MIHQEQTIKNGSCLKETLMQLVQPAQLVPPNKTKEQAWGKRKIYLISYLLRIPILELSVIKQQTF